MNVYKVIDGKCVLYSTEGPSTRTVSRNFHLPVGRGMTSSELKLRISMPAVLDEDFSFGFGKRSLILYGVRREPTDFGEPMQKRFGLPYGHFHQSIALPEGLDLDKLEARLHHGVLDIRIPFLPLGAALAVPAQLPVTLDAVACVSA